MTTHQLPLVSGPWRRPYDRRETPLWVATTASPIAWLAHLVGLSTVAALGLAILAGVIAALQLRSLYAHGDRSRQRSWFLAQTGVTLSTVVMLLILLEHVRA